MNIYIHRHPHSVDALCALPASLPNVDHSSVILTGSSDGFVRAVSVFPTKLQGVVVDHGEWPVERIAVGEGMSQLTLDDDSAESVDVLNRVRANQPNVHAKKAGDDADDDEDHCEDSLGHHWAGSAAHDELLKLTNLRSFFNGKDAELGVDERQDKDENSRDGISDSEDERPGDSMPPHMPGTIAKEASDEGSNADSDIEPEASRPKKRRKKEKEPLAVNKKKGKNEVEVEGGFFAEL